MTREQARAILAHLDLIRHFANGGEVGLRLHDYKGKFVQTYRAKHIVLSNLRENGTNLVKLKTRYVFNKTLGVWEHKPYGVTEPIPDFQIIKEKT